MDGNDVDVRARILANRVDLNKPNGASLSAPAGSHDGNESLTVGARTRHRIWVDVLALD